MKRVFLGLVAAFGISSILLGQTIVPPGTTAVAPPGTTNY